MCRKSCDTWLDSGKLQDRKEYTNPKDRSSSIMVRNNSIVGVDTQITLNLRSRVGGLVRVERKKKRIELKIFSGDIHFPGETDKISRHTGVLIPPGTGKRNSKESKKVKNWIDLCPTDYT